MAQSEVELDREALGLAEQAPNREDKVNDRQLPQDIAEPKRDGLLAGWVQFKADVFGARRSVQPLSGWLLSGLLGLVIWLTVYYAPGAFERAKQAHGADPAGVITMDAAYFTIITVALLSLAVAFEPFLSRFIGNRQKALLKALGTSSAWVRLPVVWLGKAIWFIWQLPSIVLSFFDYILARPIAVAVGTSLQGWPRRYACGAVVIFAAIAAGLYAHAPWGLYAVGAGMIAILAIVRRWSWSESDRETFLVERGIREGAMRVGFKEDLRDEALIALTFLFVLIPVGLRQIQQATCGAGDCAFTLDGDAALPAGTLGQFIAWLGYFGAELAKSVPFVDWSEVFHVANDSPIEPLTPFGAQIVFVMRAMLDLLLLAAVLQAVQIASRLREQWTAFDANRLPILEPFTEARLLKSTVEAIEPCLEQHPAEQHAIAEFPAYEDKRLKELIQERRSGTPPEVRKAAVALLACQHASEATDQFFTDEEKEEDDLEMRDWIVHVACGVTREHDASDLDAHRSRLEALLKDSFEAVQVRAAAARCLGRMPAAITSTALLQEQLANTKGNKEEKIARLELRAAAALALAKHKQKDALADIEKLAGTFSGELRGDKLIAEMATAHALARLSNASDVEAVANAFDAPLREWARQAARIQLDPMDIEAAKAREPGTALNQMVRIAPGEGPFKSTFTMGSGDDDDQAFPSDKPPKEITMTQAYAIGRYAVTQEEFGLFTEATGYTTSPFRRQQDNGTFSPRWPAFEVNWRDAMAYCKWLEAITGEVYRLPSEVEWEYACRAGTTTRYSWGDDFDVERANSNRTQPNSPKEVGSYDPNDWGLWQMHGNVYEWCGDPWHETHEGRPAGQSVWAADGAYGLRVLRGGSWLNIPQLLRSAGRGWNSTDVRVSGIGFRLSRTLNLAS